MSYYRKYSDRECWFNEKDQLHREDGPAVEYVHGSKYWYNNGQLHRLDGPAIEYKYISKAWWINGNPYSKKQFPIAVIMFLLSCDKKAAGLIIGLFNNAV
jgi:hypothetical protein